MYGAGAPRSEVGGEADLNAACVGRGVPYEVPIPGAPVVEAEDRLFGGSKADARHDGEKLVVDLFACRAERRHVEIGRLEAQHARHTQEELEEIYFGRDIDEDAFLRCGNEMLDGVAAFWDGLDTQRKDIARAA